MIKVAIIEDEQKEIDNLTQYFERFGEANGVEFSVTAYTNPVSFLSGYKCNDDLVFMDIELPSMDGMTAAQKLREIDTEVTLIFVTNMAQFAVKGYEVDAFDFIVKPVGYSAFSLKLKRALDRCRMRSDVKIKITTSDGVECISSSEIKYVEILNHNLIYHTTRGDIASYGQLKKIEEPLLKNNFVRCNRCYLVNLRYVTSVKGLTAYVGGDELQISHLKNKEFLKALADYLGGGV